METSITNGIHEDMQRDVTTDLLQSLPSTWLSQQCFNYNS